MTASEYVKAKGFKSIKQLSELSGIDYQKLQNLYKFDHKRQLDLIIKGVQAELDNT